MREYIKKQLLSLELANIEYYETVDKYYFIPKYSKPTYKVDTMYLVEVDSSVLNTEETNYLPHKYLKIYVSQLDGGSIIIDAIACNPITKQDLNYYWSGKIKEKYLTQLAVL